ncbi:MAG: hypothetical protein KAK04_01690 [Cyclobacteriaceae bacterium]|nr:hypothetical protein [Cyclobacteriaceae bacterium]
MMDKGGANAKVGASLLCSNCKSNFLDLIGFNGSSHRNAAKMHFTLDLLSYTKKSSNTLNYNHL